MTPFNTSQLPFLLGCQLTTQHTPGNLTPSPEVCNPIQRSITDPEETLQSNEKEGGRLTAHLLLTLSVLTLGLNKLAHSIVFHLERKITIYDFSESLGESLNQNTLWMSQKYFMKIKYARECL